jgi:hypothetical protein
MHGDSIGDTPYLNVIGGPSAANLLLARDAMRSIFRATVAPQRLGAYDHPGSRTASAVSIVYSARGLRYETAT